MHNLPFVRLLCPLLWLACGSMTPMLAQAKQKPVAIPACAAVDDLVSRVRNAPSETSRKEIVDDFVACARNSQVPLWEKSSRPGFARAVFLYRGAADKVALAGDMSDWQPKEMFTRVAGTNLFYLVQEFEADARLDYKLVLNDKEWIFDPLNPRTAPSGFGGNSHFWMPGYVAPKAIADDPRIPHGTLEEFSWKSDSLKNERAVKVYLPPGYAPSGARYPTLYVHDGTDYVNYAKITNILDHVIAGKEVPPLVAVLVPPVAREREYMNNEDFARAFVQELVPMVDARYRARAEAKSRAVMGASLGGLISVFMALHYPGTFGNVISQSTGILANGPIDQFKNAPKSDIVFHIDVGTYEEHFHNANLLEGNRILRRILEERGHRVDYLEVHEGHSWASWRARVAPALRFIWGSSLPAPTKKK